MFSLGLLSLIRFGDQALYGDYSRANVFGLSAHMHQEPSVLTVLEARPVAVSADLGGRGMEEKADVAGDLLFGPALKGPVGRLVGAAVCISLLRPAASLPVGNLLALDPNSGAVPPHR